MAYTVCDLRHRLQRRGRLRQQLDHSDKEQVVLRIDPEPGPRGAVPLIGALANRNPGGHGIGENRAVKAIAKAPADLLVAHTETCSKHLRRQMVRHLQFCRLWADDARAGKFAAVQEHLGVARIVRRFRDQSAAAGRQSGRAVVIAHERIGHRHKAAALARPIQSREPLALGGRRVERRVHHSERSEYPVLHELRQSLSAQPLDQRDRACQHVLVDQTLHGGIDVGNSGG